MRCQPGDRAGAIMKSRITAEDSTVWLFGYGVYVGDQIPDPALNVGLFGIPMEHENPCVRLDSGKLVYGCECWWGPESKIKEMVSTFKNVIDVDIEAERKSRREEEQA